MLHSTEYAGVKGRQCQSVHCAQWGWLPSWTRLVLETGWNTAFKQLGTASDWEFILHLVESVYQGCTPVGQSRLQPDTVKHVTAEIKEDLKKHIRSHRSSQAPTRDQSEIHFTVWSLARSPWRTEGATVHVPDQYHSWRQRSPNQRHRSKTWRPCSKSCWHCSKNQRWRNCDEWSSCHGSTGLKNECRANWSFEGVRVPRNVASMYRSMTQRPMI